MSLPSVVVSAVLGSGCASVPDDGGARDVRARVDARLQGADAPGPDPHAAHGAPASEHDAHAAHGAPASEHDAHAGHGTAASEHDAHAGHGAPASEHDAHAGHGAAASEHDAHAGHGTAASEHDAHAGHGAAATAANLDPSALTLDRVARLTLDTHPRVQAALATLGVARAAILSEGAIPNPVAEGELFFGESEDGEVGVELGLRQSLTGLLFASRRSAVARAGLEAEQAGAAEAVLEVVFGAQRAFVRWQAAAQRVELARTTLRASDAAYEAARALHASGNLTELRLLGEQDLLERAKLGLHDAQRAHVGARHQLDAAIGAWGEGTRWTADPRLPAPTALSLTAAEAERRAVEASLGLARRRHQLAASDAQGSLAGLSGWLPDVEVGVAARREPGHEWAVGPSLEIALPLFDQARGAVARADAELLQTRELYAAEAVELRAAARSALSEARGLGERARHYQGVVVPLRTRIVRATELHVNAMDASVFDLITAKRAEIEAQGASLDTLERYWTARLELDRILAGGRPAIASPESASETTADDSAGAARGAH